MRILAIGGMSSGVGKTTMICRILPCLPGWGVLKTSVRSGKKARADLPTDRYEIVTEAAELQVPGKDTGLYHQAGAAALAWLRTGPEGLAPGVPRALARFRHLPGVVVEGNSHTFHQPPHRLILVASTALAEIKPTAGMLLPRADLVVLNQVTGEHSGGLSRDTLQANGASCPILEEDVLSDRFLERFQALISTWFPPSP